MIHQSEPATAHCLVFNPATGLDMDVLVSLLALLRIVLDILAAPRAALQYLRCPHIGRFSAQTARSLYSSSEIRYPVRPDYVVLFAPSTRPLNRSLLFVARLDVELVIFRRSKSLIPRDSSTSIASLLPPTIESAGR